MAIAPYARGPRGAEIMPVRATGDVCRINLTWQVTTHRSARFDVHGRRLPSGDLSAGRLRPTVQNLVAQVDEPHFVHAGLDPAGERWEYLVVAVDDVGALCAITDPVVCQSITSVTTTGRAVATVGRFDGLGNELALSPSGYVRYQSRFPDGVDFHHGRDVPALSWSYLQPGPDDAWAGRRGHRFRLHFDLDAAPTEDLDLALWLTDRHPVRAGTAGLVVNEHRLEPLLFTDDTGIPVLGRTTPGRGAGPIQIERPLPAEVFRAGENVLDVVKDQGSWIAYDALGVFARS